MNRIRRRSLSSANAFTLVELLVVIGIIALLIAILLPTLGRAREQANNIKCLSNVRQLMVASILFAQDHRGFIPTVSDDSYAEAYDPYRQYFVYRADSTRGSGYVKDWASSLLPYLGMKDADYNAYITNAIGTTGQQHVAPPIMICPSDPMQGMGDQSGYAIQNNVVSPADDPNGYFPISYGINADVACLTDLANPPVGHFGTSDSVNVYNGPNGDPLCCHLNNIYMPSQVLMFADCGTRPGTGGNPLDHNDSLYYTTNYDTGATGVPNNMYGTLGATLKASWLWSRVPSAIPASVSYDGKPHNLQDRHRGHINVVFADGHAASVAPADFFNVRVSPYHP